MTLGTTSYSSTFGGVIVTDNETHLDVYLTNLDSSVEGHFQSLAPLGTITFLQSPNTLAALYATVSSIEAAQSELQSEGIDTALWYSDVSSGTVVVEVVSSPGASMATSTLDQEFGADLLTIKQISKADAPVQLSRSVDSSPWSASDSIEGFWYNGATPGCSLGYGGSTSGHGNVTMTAEHCYPDGSSVENAVQANSANGGWIPSSGAPVIGHVAAQNDSSGTELVSSTSSGEIWAGAIGSATLKPVSGYTTNPVGDDICTDGTYDGALGSNASPSYCGAGTGSTQIQIFTDDACQATFVPTNSSPYGYNYNLCGLVGAASTINPGLAVGGSGDSGGPVYRTTNSGANLYAVGIIQAGNITATCPYNQQGGTRTCFSTVYYSAMNAILSDWGMTLATHG
jgi:hypothetical protein